MKSFTVNLTTMDNVNMFSGVVTNYNEQIDAKSGNYTINAKSTAGLISLDLSTPITVSIYTDDTTRSDQFKSDLGSLVIS